MTLRSLAAASGLLLAAACDYQFNNPAEDLRYGEARGRVVADQGAGTAPFAGVSVSLKHSSLSQVSRDTGRFMLLPLPVGRHTLLFRKGTAWALEREVEVAWGKDGQPEGVSVGDVLLRYGAAVSGRVELPDGSWPANAVVVDEVTGLTTTVAAGAFEFPVLSAGLHRFKAAAATSEVVGGTLVERRFVTSPIAATLGPQNERQNVRLATLRLRDANATGRIRFKVQAVVSSFTFDPASVQAELRRPGHPAAEPPAYTFVPDAAGVVDAEVAEGAYEVTVVGRGGTVLAKAGATLQAPGDLSAPPTATAVVAGDGTADLGALYVVEPDAAAVASVGCFEAADCACVGTSCTGTEPGTCTQGVCQGWTPPAAAPATTPFCTLPESEAGTCFDVGDCGTGVLDGYCARRPGTTRSLGVCVRCGQSCTFDGVTASAPAATECAATRTVSVALVADYWDEFTQTRLPRTLGAGDAVSAVPVGSSAALLGSPNAQTGNWDIPSVPYGRYLLAVDQRSSGGVYTATEQESSSPDVLLELQGRAAAARPTRATAVTIDVIGLTPWVATDELQLACLGTGGFDVLVGPGAPLSLPAGTSSGRIGFDWLTMMKSPLPDGALGDKLWVSHLGTVGATGLPSGTVVLSALDATVISSTALAVVDGGPGALAAQLAAAPQTGSVSVGATLSAYRTLAAELPPAAVEAGFVLAVEGAPQATSWPAPIAPLGRPQELEITYPAGAADVAETTVPYGQFLDGFWSPVVVAGMRWSIQATAPGASAPITIPLAIRSEWPLASAPAVHAPALAPPRAPTVNGQPAFAALTGVGTTPLLGWTAPAPLAPGDLVPNRYRVTLHQLDVANGATVATVIARFTLRPAYAGQTAFTLRMPSGLLVAGHAYVAEIAAVASASDHLDGEVAAESPNHLASTSTATFAP